MRKTTLSTLSLSLVCLLALVGCKPSGDKASASGATSTKSSTATPAQPTAAPQAAMSKASPMTPGLWELKMESDMMKNMPRPKISPQQAEQMRKMGIKMPEQSDGGMVMKVCYTKEMLAEKDVPSSPNDKECKPTNMTRSGDSFSGQVVCDTPEMKGTGTIQGTMSATSYQFTSSFNGTMGGQPVNHTSKMSGAFISADCGNVKPLHGM